MNASPFLVEFCVLWGCGRPNMGPEIAIGVLACWENHYRTLLVGGWAYPSEQYDSLLGWWHSKYMENKKWSKPPTRLNLDQSWIHPWLQLCHDFFHLGKKRRVGMGQNPTAPCGSLSKDKLHGLCGNRSLVMNPNFFIQGVGRNGYLNHQMNDIKNNQNLWSKRAPCWTHQPSSSRTPASTLWAKSQFRTVATHYFDWTMFNSYVTIIIRW